MLREEQLLANAIRDNLHNARQAITKKDFIEERLSKASDPESLGEDLSRAEHALEYNIEQCFLHLLILVEHMRLPLLRREIARSRDHFAGKMSDTRPSRFDMGSECPALMSAQKYFSSIESMLDTKALTSLDVFETILERTGQIIERSQNPQPSNEAQVRAQVFEILKLAFRNATRETSFANTFKTYKADFAIPELKAVAEYKFARSKDEVGKLLGGIYEDMKGYSGHDDYQNFYAVIYMTGQFYDQKDFDREFQLVKADLRWRPIAVFGAGKRKAKAAKNSRSSPT